MHGVKYKIFINYISAIIDRVVCLCYITLTDHPVCFLEAKIMKREEKNTLSRQRILDAALQEFSARGYEGMSLNTVCAEYGISKGIIYHHFKDKDELYLRCVAECFDALTAYLQEAASELAGPAEQRLRGYFDARIRFFAENPLYLGIFADVAWHPPAAIADRIAECRKEFDALNISVLTELLNGRTLRKGLSVPAIVEDFRSYMDFFNMRFKADFSYQTSQREGSAEAPSCEKYSAEALLRKHEERCHRQLDILLYGVMGEKNEE